MPRLLAAALAALLLLPGAALAQGGKDDTAPAATPAAPAAQPAQPAPAAPAAPADLSQLDPKTRAAIQKEIEKAKDDIRNEVRAEIQGAQSAAEFMGAVAEGPKLQFFQLNGYFRTRGQLLDSLDLGRGPDASGYYLFPIPLQSTNGGTLATANMRLRLEPTINVSEHVRLRAQVDVLDNYVLGSSNSHLYDSAHAPSPSTWYGSSATLDPTAATAERPAILPKRVWAEVQTPVGLLSFGRMPSEWGLGILTTAGGGIDDDYGDTFDRLQFALPPVQTPIGALSIVPILQFDSEGVLHPDVFGRGLGQPFDAEPGDDGRTYALKVARLDTADELRRKAERGEGSFNFGVYYNYRTQRWTYPTWFVNGFSGSYADTGIATTDQKVKRGAYAHVVDFWARWLSGKWRVEFEGVGVYGVLGQAGTVSINTSGGVDTTQLQRVLLRQWGGTLVTDYKAIPSKLTLGLDVGVASGDNAPGFGNQPDRMGTDTAGNPVLPPLGSVEGPQFGQNGDHSIRNFQYNPGYVIDIILWRRILGAVTDAWYAKPRLRWDILPGLAFDGAVVYSQAIYGESTPSAYVDPSTLAIHNGHTPLGIEGDGKLSLDSGDGFVAWGEIGVLQPLAGFGPGHTTRAWALNFGLAVKF